MVILDVLIDELVDHSDMLDEAITRDGYVAAQMTLEGSLGTRGRFGGNLGR